MVTGEITFYVVSKIRVVSVVTSEIIFFNAVFKISVVSIVSGVIIFYVVSKISVVSVASEEIIFM